MRHVGWERIAITCRPSPDEGFTSDRRPSIYYPPTTLNYDSAFVSENVFAPKTNWDSAASKTRKQSRRVGTRVIKWRSLCEYELWLPKFERLNHRRRLCASCEKFTYAGLRLAAFADCRTSIPRRARSACHVMVGSIDTKFET